MLAEILEEHLGSDTTKPWMILRHRRTACQKKHHVATRNRIDFSGTLYNRLPSDEQLALILAAKLKMRVSEVVRARMKDLHIDDARPHILVIGKGNKPRAIPVQPKTVTELKRLLAGRQIEYLLCKTNGAPYSERGADKKIRRSLRKLGIVDNSHGCRRMGANEDILDGKGLRDTADEMGHTFPYTLIMNYLNVQAEKTYEILRGNNYMEELKDLLDVVCPMISSAQAAAMLGVSVRRIQQLGKDGTLLGAKIKGKWQFKESEIKRYLLQ